MKKVFKFLRKILYYIFEKNGRAKMGISALLIAILISMFAITGRLYPIWWQLALIPGIYLGLFAVIGIMYAWIIWPIKSLIEWRKKKKSEKE